MTVLRLNSVAYSFSRRRSGFAGLRRRGGYSVYQTRQTRRFPDTQHTVITEKSRPLSAISGEGVRWDVLVVALSLVLLLIVCILGADLEAMVNSGKRISKLNAAIISLEVDNSFLQEQISRAAAESFFLQKTGSAESEKIVFLSPASVE